MKYAVGRSGVLGIQFHRENYSLGLSYDFPIGNNVANLGALEIGLEYRTPVDPRSKRELARKRNLKKKKPSQAQAKTKGKPEKNQTPLKPTKPTLTSAGETERTTVNPMQDSLSADRPVEIVRLDTLQPTNRNSTPEAVAGRINHEPLLVEKITLHFRFEYNSTDLDDETERFIEDLSKTLLDNPDLSVQVIGHTDNVGTAHLNQRLSVKRAEAVKSYLIKAGVDAGRLLTEGKGMNEPLNANSNEAERAHNRRVEIKLFRQ